MDLRAAREALGLSQPALAKEMGVDPSTVSRWETGRTEMPPPAQKLLEMMLRDRVGPAAAPSSTPAPEAA